MRTNISSPPRRIMRLPEVKERTGLSSAWLYELMRKGLFPENFKIVPNGRACGWWESDIEDYLASRENGGAK